MFTSEQINKVKGELPIRAAYTIAEDTGISRPTIYKFFNGGQVRSYYANEIMESALKLVEQKNFTVNSLQKKYQTLLGTEKMADELSTERNTGINGQAA